MERTDMTRAVIDRLIADRLADSRFQARNMIRNGADRLHGPDARAAVDDICGLEPGEEP